jgi:hypothetical protein
LPPLPTDAGVSESKILVARFHPLADDRQIVIVGLVVCAPHGASLQAPPSTGAFTAPAGLLIKLRYLVERAAPNTFESLRKLRSRFWSFIEFFPVEKESDA